MPNSKQRWPHLHFLWLSFVLTLLAMGAVYAIFGDAKHFWDENSSVEFLQLGVLALSVVVSFFAYLKSNDPLVKAVVFAIFGFGVIIIIKEFPKCGGKSTKLLPDICISIALRNIVVTTMAAALVVRSIYVVVWQRDTLSALLHPRYGWPAYPFIGCFIGAVICDDFDLEWLEESLELFGFAMMLVISVQLLLTRRIQPASQERSDSGCTAMDSRSLLTD